MDTVFYKFESNYYSSEYFSNPEPHLTYSFGSRTSDKFYTNLDSSIFTIFLDFNELTENWPDLFFTYDSINEVSTKWCDIILNGYEANVGDFEPSLYKYIYGKGVGLISKFYQSGDSGGIIDEDTKLVYYKKSETSCGTADVTSVFENQMNSTQTKIYPNPTSSSFTVELASENNFILEVFTLQGKVLDHQNVQGNVYSYDLSKMEKGIYIIKISSSTGVFYHKVFKN
jgi:hypothetical protein